MRYIEAPSPLIVTGPSVFLAGSISGAWDWRVKVVHMLKAEGIFNATIVNPKRPVEYTPDMDTEQITWEYCALRKCDCLFFYFSHETVAPITLFELGSAMERGTQDIIICADREYPRLRDLEIQTSLVRHQTVTVGLESGVRRLMEYLGTTFL